MKSKYDVLTYPNEHIYLAIIFLVDRKLYQVKENWSLIHVFPKIIIQIFLLWIEIAVSIERVKYNKEFFLFESLQKSRWV